MPSTRPLPANVCRRVAARLLRRGLYQQAHNEYWRAMDLAEHRHPRAYRKARRMAALCVLLAHRRDPARKLAA